MSAADVVGMTVIGLMCAVAIFLMVRWARQEAREDQDRIDGLIWWARCEMDDAARRRAEGQ